MSKKTYIPKEEVIEAEQVEAIPVAEIVPESVVEVTSDDSVKITEETEKLEPANHELVQEVLTQATGEMPTESKVPESAPRDYMAEAERLMKAHPELTHTAVPDEVFRVCVETDTPMLQAYDAYLIGQLRGELAKAKAEIETLMHNAETAMRAPVTGIKVGGMPEIEENDFLKGFMRV